MLAWLQVGLSFLGSSEAAQFSQSLCAIFHSPTPPFFFCPVLEKGVRPSPVPLLLENDQILALQFEADKGEQAW